METVKKIVMAFIYFIMDGIMITLMYGGIWKTAVVELILMFVLIFKAVMYVKKDIKIGKIGTCIIFIMGLFQLDYSKIMHDLSERVSSALEPIMIFIIFCGFMVYGIRQLSGENTYKNPSKRAGIRKRTSKRYSYKDRNDYNGDSLSSEIYERASKKSDIPSGACPYINRDNKGYLYCNISGGEREIDSYTFSSKCKWSDTFRKCNIYTNLNGHEYIMEDLRRDGENDYQSSSSRYECPYIFQDRGGYRYCTAGGGKEPVDSWQYSHSCNHQGNGDSGYTGCHIYLVNK